VQACSSNLVSGAPRLNGYAEANREPDHPRRLAHRYGIERGFKSLKRSRHVCSPRPVTLASGFGRQRLGVPEREVGQFLTSSLEEQGFGMERKT
jgi:hypothetical protein